MWRPGRQRRLRHRLRRHPRSDPGWGARSRARRSCSDGRSGQGRPHHPSGSSGDDLRLGRQLHEPRRRGSRLRSRRRAALGFHQAVLRCNRPWRGHRHPSQRRRHQARARRHRGPVARVRVCGRLRGRVRRGDRQDCQERAGGGRARLRLRIHGDQRRRRSLRAVPQLPDRPRKELRHVLPDGAVHRHEGRASRLGERPRAVVRQRRAPPGCVRPRADRPAARGDRVAQLHHHAPPRRRALDRDSRSAAARSWTRRHSSSLATSSPSRPPESAS